MNDHPFDQGSAPAQAPYRDPCLTAPPASSDRLSSRLAGAMTAALFASTVMSAVTTYTLTRAVAISSVAQARATVRVRSNEPDARLDTAVLELSRRSRLSLYVAPDAVALARAASISSGALEGAPREAIRALDSYAAARGLWAHDVDNVLRLEREVTSVDLSCDDTLDVCATRLERVASVTIEQRGGASNARVHLRARVGESALEAMRVAAVTEGMQVDVQGRSLYITAAATTPPGEADASLRSAIRVLPGRRYAIARSAVDRSLNDGGRLMHGVNIMPESRSGRVVGVRVFGVREGSVLAALGLESNDVLLRVNDLDVASPDNCLQAYAAMRSTDRVTLLIERDRRLVTLRYQIVDG